MLKFIFILFCFLLTLNLYAQQITNIKVTQEGDKVIINYDISGAKAGQTFDIKVECSDDGGKTFSISPKSLIGELTEVSTGTGKKIIWDVLSEKEELAGDHFIFQLVGSVSYSGNSGTFTDRRDGHVYKWVRIDDQVWMAENLAYLPKANLPNKTATNSRRDANYYIYEYTSNNTDDAKSTVNYKIYGVLYSWSAAMESAPKGWRLPQNYEWDILESHSGSDLKEIGTAHWNSPNTGANNKSGFNALPGGYLDDGIFYGIGQSGWWWSSTEGVNWWDDAWQSHLYYNESKITGGMSNKNHGYSVRCIKD